MHDILLLRISAILPEAISDVGFTPTTDTDLLLATYRGGSHFTSDIKSPSGCSFGRSLPEGELFITYRLLFLSALFYCHDLEVLLFLLLQFQDPTASGLLRLLED